MQEPWKVRYKSSQYHASITRASDPSYITLHFFLHDKKPNKKLMDSLQYSYEPTLDKGKWSQSSVYEGTEAEEILLLQFGFPELDDQFIVKFKGLKERSKTLSNMFKVQTLIYL